MTCRSWDQFIMMYVSKRCYGDKLIEQLFTLQMISRSFQQNTKLLKYYFLAFLCVFISVVRIVQSRRFLKANPSKGFTYALKIQYQCYVLHIAACKST